MSLERETNADEIIFVPQAKAENASQESSALLDTSFPPRSPEQGNAIADMAALFPLAGVVWGTKRTPFEGQARCGERNAHNGVAACCSLLTAERIEQDLWHHYMELALDNPDLHHALFAMDDCF